MLFRRERLGGCEMKGQILRDIPCLEGTCTTTKVQSSMFGTLGIETQTDLKGIDFRKCEWDQTAKRLGEGKVQIRNGFRGKYISLHSARFLAYQQVHGVWKIEQLVCQRCKERVRERLVGIGAPSVALTTPDTSTLHSSCLVRETRLILRREKGRKEIHLSRVYGMKENEEGTTRESEHVRY